MEYIVLIQYKWLKIILPSILSSPSSIYKKKQSHSTLCSTGIERCEKETYLENKDTRQRIITFDVMKGIGILLMILGHQDGAPLILKHFIYAFHMPLFFIIAGYLYRIKSINEEIKKDFIRLGVPYLFTAVIIILLSLLSSIHSGSYDRFYKNAYAIMDGNCGPIWFLMALFWCKSLYNLIKNIFDNKYRVFLCTLLTAFMGIELYHLKIPNILSFQQGCSALFFFGVGTLLKEYGVKVNSKIGWLFVIFTSVFYFICALYVHMDMVECFYENWIVNVLSGIGGTQLLYLFVRKIEHIKYVAAVLSWIGVASLPILCFHTLERGTILGAFWIYIIDKHWMYQFIIRVFFSISCAFLCTQMTFTRKIFGIQ